jgi:hypothetical protein
MGHWHRVELIGLKARLAVWACAPTVGRTARGETAHVVTATALDTTPFPRPSGGDVAL